MKQTYAQPEVSISTDVYTVEEIAGKLNLKMRTAYHFCNTTSVFEVVRVGRQIRVKKQSFDAWWNTDSRLPI